MEWINDLLPFITLIVVFFGLKLYFQNKNERIIIKNFSDKWMPIGILRPQKSKTDLETYQKVLVTITDPNKGKLVTECLYDFTSKRFIGITKDFERRIVAWMPLPEPFKTK